jgi:hypothetical protein
MNKVNADTAAASAVANAVASEDLESGFLPEDPEYRKTGKLSEKDSDDEKDEKDEKSAATEQETEKENADTEEASAASTEEENADTAAASAAAKTQEQKDKGKTKTPDTSENRYRKITRENRELREKLARLEGREEGRSSTQTSRESTEQTSQAAADGKTPRPQIDDVDPKTGKAKYATYADYEAAKDDWLKQETLREFQESSSKTQRQREMQAAEQEIAKGMAKKFEKTRAKFKDFDEVALNPDLIIPKGSVTDAFLLDSEHAGEVAYHLGKNPEILEGFYGDYDPKTGKFVNKLTPQQQFRKLMAIEAEVSKDKPASAKPVTQAPRPPNQVDGKNAVTKSARDQALEDGDLDTYRNDANATDPRLLAVRASRKKG